jgi:predicted dehydrogenase
MAVPAGKQVLVEKPGGTTAQELEQLESLARHRRVLVLAGRNHRSHPACLRALEPWHGGVLEQSACAGAGNDEYRAPSAISLTG